MPLRRFVLGLDGAGEVWQGQAGPEGGGPGRRGMMGRGWTSERSLNIPRVNNGAADLLLALFSETLFTCLCSGSTAVLFNMPSVSLL